MTHDTGASDWESTVLAVHDWNGDASLERSIAESLHRLRPFDRSTRPSAAESERVQAVERLFTESSLVAGELHLAYADSEVTVKSNGVLHIEVSADER